MAEEIATDDTLSYEQVDNANLSGDINNDTNIVKIFGEVFANYHGKLIGFRSPEYSGIFIISSSGQVEYSPHDPNRSLYIVGENGQIK